MVQEPRDLALLEGDTAVFTCHASGHPPPSVTWAKSRMLILLKILKCDLS